MIRQRFMWKIYMSDMADKQRIKYIEHKGIYEKASKDVRPIWGRKPSTDEYYITSNDTIVRCRSDMGLDI